MRNWNWDAFCALSQVGLCCEPTYEELKLQKAGFDQSRGTVASLPMRNWNSFLLNRKGSRWRRCEPTYEELKQLMAALQKYHSLGCEPTYEELKPPTTSWMESQSTQLRAYLWGIETYVSRDSFSSGCCVASLPMRNWNDISDIADFVTDYVASLPMRNWNVPSFVSTSITFLCCEPTYEELKLTRLENTQHLQTGLRAYLWGIETLVKLYKCSLSYRLRAYLWGIETVLCTKQ